MFTIEPSLIGSSMRDELIRLYNLFCQWSDIHSKCDSEKKRLESIMEIELSKIKRKKMEDIKNSALNMKEKEYMLNDVWHEEFLLDEVKLTVQELQRQITDMSAQEIESRHKMNALSSAIDVARTCLSWDKAELLKMGD